MTRRKTLKAARCLAALSQLELATLAGVAQETVCKIECSRCRPYWSTIRRISAALELHPRDIIWPGNPLGIVGDEEAA